MTKMIPEEFGLKLTICESFDFMKNWIKTKPRTFGLDYDTNEFRFIENDDEVITLCNK